MRFIQETKARKAAREIDQINEETIAFLKAQMKRSHALANTPGEEQAIMSEFGENAAKALGFYESIFNAIDSLGESEDVPSPDRERFQPQPNGTVNFNKP